MQEPILLSWSGGKDSAMALFELRNSERYQVASLLTTITEPYDRISMHGVRRVLLEQQAESIGVPLQQIGISNCCRNEEYEAKMRTALEVHQQNGIESVAFGDIFLQDLRSYREEKLSKIGMKALFPIWKQDSRVLVRRFLQLGFRALIVCVDGKVLDKSYAGRAIDEEFLQNLPANIDPCGENGEFHSFVFDGPLFRRPVRFSKGEVVLRETFYFCDLLSQ